jgi:hypothetical protein
MTAGQPCARLFAQACGHVEGGPLRTFSGEGAAAARSFSSSPAEASRGRRSPAASTALLAAGGYPLIIGSTTKLALITLRLTRFD